MRDERKHKFKILSNVVYGIDALIAASSAVPVNEVAQHGYIRFMRHSDNDAVIEKCMHSSMMIRSLVAV